MSLGIEGVTRMGKSQIIEAIRDHVASKGLSLHHMLDD